MGGREYEVWVGGNKGGKMGQKNVLLTFNILKTLKDASRSVNI